MASKESMDSSSNNNNNSSSYNDTEAIAAAAETTTGDDDAPTAVSRSKRLREQEAQQDDNSNGEPEGKRTRLGRAAKRANSGGDDGEEVDDMMPVTATEAPESREQGESPNNAAQGESTDSTSNPRWRGTWNAHRILWACRLQYIKRCIFLINSVSSFIYLLYTAITMTHIIYKHKQNNHSQRTKWPKTISISPATSCSIQRRSWDLTDTPLLRVMELMVAVVTTHLIQYRLWDT